MSAVNKVPTSDIVNRLSPLQRAIVEILQRMPGPGADVDEDGCVYMGHLPFTGDIIDMLGRPRDRKSYASVSRSLGRLVSTGLVECSQAWFHRGKGFRYWLAGAEPYRGPRRERPAPTRFEPRDNAPDQPEPRDAIEIIPPRQRCHLRRRQVG
jgi:hypothetical protein